MITMVLWLFAFICCKLELKPAFIPGGPIIIAMSVLSPGIYYSFNHHNCHISKHRVDFLMLHLIEDLIQTF